MTRIAATWAFLELVAAATADAADGEVVSRTAARGPPPTRAGGQDDGSKISSLKLHWIIDFFFSMVILSIGFPGKSLI